MARGLIDVVTDLNSRGAGAVGKVGVPPDTGLEQAFSSFAKDFKVIGDQIGQMADKAAASEGELEGKFAGLDPQFRTRRDGTIRGEAFDKAGLQIAETRLNQTLSAGISGASEKHGRDPEKLAQAIDGVGAGVLKGVPDELKPKFLLKIRGQRLSAMREAARAKADEIRVGQIGALNDELQQGYKDTQRLAFNLGLDAEADKALGDRVGLLAEALARKGLNGKPLVAPEAARKYLDKIKGEITEARLMGAFDRIKDPGGRALFIRQMEANWASGEGIAKEFDLDRMTALRGRLEAEMRHDEARRSVAGRLLEREIKDAVEVAKKGFPIGEERMAALKSQVGQTGDPALEEALAGADALAKWQIGARSQSPAALEAFVRSETAQMQQGGATKGRVERMKMADGILSEMRKELKQDPNGWADRVGLVPRAPVDMSSPEKFAATLPGRIAGAEEVGARYDNPVQYLDQDERRKLVAMAAPGGAQLMDVVAAVTAAAGGRAPKILAELGKDAPTLAVLGGHVGLLGKTAVAADVADGVALSRTKDFKGHPLSVDKSATLALGVHKGALAGMPTTEQALINATNYAYAVRLQSSGKTESNELWQRTFRELLGERQHDGETYGGIGTWRSSKIVVPPDVKQDGFGDLIRAIDPADFGDNPPMTGSGPATVGDIRNARLEPVGSGRWRMNLGDADNPQWLADRDGRPFVLDIAALKPKLMERRPWLYLDGGKPKYPPGMMRLGGPVPPIEAPRDPVDEAFSNAPVGGDLAKFAARKSYKGKDNDRLISLAHEEAYDPGYDPTFEKSSEGLMEGRPARMQGRFGSGWSNDPAAELFRGGARDERVSVEDEDKAAEAVYDFAHQKWPEMFPRTGASDDVAIAAHEKRLAGGPTTAEVIREARKHLSAKVIRDFLLAQGLDPEMGK